MKRLCLALGILITTMFSLAEAALAQSLNVPAIEAACTAGAKSTPSSIRPGNTKMWCAVTDREGKLLAINATDTGGTPQAPAGSDAWRGSIEIAIAKAYTAVAFSSNNVALDSREIGLLSRTDAGGVGAVGSDTGPGPLWGIGDSNPFRSALGFFEGGDDFLGGYHHGIITFAGGQPVYTKGPNGGCGHGILIGAVGVSGDGVDQDDDVAILAVTNGGFCLTP